jgi:uncharacterized protein (UPF0332 family)
LDPLDLLKAATDLVSSNKGKPRQANLLRAISTTYYALFHVLAKACADLLIGASRAARSEGAWRQVYRALDHGQAKNACKNKDQMERLPQELQDFAILFISMQEKRHKADYHPKMVVYKSDVYSISSLPKRPSHNSAG